MNKTQQLWKEAKKIIPGGSQLLSKRPEMFLPGQWPPYYQKAKGIEITDLDGRKYIDMSLMGVGACVLGYADPDVNNAVKRAIELGSMSTLNSWEEVELAKLLLKLNPWAQSARFTRTGGEAMAVAIRIARAYTGRSAVAFCGYHGWHDWYLSVNLSSGKNLDGIHLSGLEPCGIPAGLINTSIPFHYNKIGELKKAVSRYKVGVIAMEVIRHQEPEPGFLEEVRAIANKIGAVLIFDEISSGFRSHLGGVHPKYKIIPDMAVYGKAMSNGFPMAAVVGKKKIMNVAQTTFISSTYWTERVGPAAALATIRKMREKNVPAHLDRIGRMIGAGWKRLAKKHNLDIDLIGPNVLITFALKYKNSQEIKTLFVQEMLKRGYLAGLTVYVSYAHKESRVKKYLQVVDEVFGILKKAIDNKSVCGLLEGPVAHSGFSRLT